MPPAQMIDRGLRMGLYGDASPDSCRWQRCSIIPMASILGR
jgi:hypothetical protein